MSAKFKTDLSKTRIIINDTEIHTQRSKHLLVQKSTFDHYKNDTTLKVVVRNTPDGLFHIIVDSIVVLQLVVKL